MTTAGHRHTRSYPDHHVRPYPDIGAETARLLALVPQDASCARRCSGLILRIT